MFRWAFLVSKTLFAFGSQVSFQSVVTNSIAIVLAFALFGCSNSVDDQTTESRPVESSGATTVANAERNNPVVALNQATEPKEQPREVLTQTSPVPQTLSTFQVPIDWTDDERRLITSIQQWDGESELKAEGVDPARVIEQLDNLAKSGDPDANFVLGSLCTNGWITPKDMSKGESYLQAAMSSGHRGAIHFHSVYVYFTSPDAKLRDASFAKLQENAEDGFNPSQTTLALILSIGLSREKDATEATKWAFLALKSQPENEQAMMYLSLSFKQASLPEEQASELFTFIEDRANTGFPDAMHLIGECYNEGAFTKKDPTKAIEWYHKAMEKDYAPAFTSMGTLLMHKAAQNDQDNKSTVEESEKIVALYRGLFSRGAELGDKGAELMLELTASFSSRRNGQADYSTENMMFRASQDALLDAAGLERIDR